MNKPRLAARTYPIRAVSRIIGVSADALRAWERRYRAVTPARSRHGRVYSDADVARLKRLAELVNQGHAIGAIAALSDERLERLVKGSSAQTARDADRPESASPLEALTSALESYDIASIEAAVNRHAAVLPPRDLVFVVVLPLLRALGQRWEAGRLRPSQEHLVSAIIRSMLGGLLRAIARPDASPRIVFATLPGERHEIGLLCAAVLAAAAGYGVVYLGMDLPEEDIAHAAKTTGARVVLLSVTTPNSTTRSAARLLARRLANAELWIGGPGAAIAVTAARDRARHVENLEQIVEMLSRHAH